MVDSLSIRKKMLKERDALSKEIIKKKSTIIKKKIFTIKEVKEADSFFVYVNFRSEVETFDIIDELLKKNKKVTVPITHLKEKRIDAIQITCPQEELTPGYCDILEPKKEMWVNKKVDPKDIGVILLPGSVFDERGGRFGYGGGYYDRFLANTPEAIRVGVAFELQIIEKAPLQDHDELMDYIVTEKRIIRGTREKICEKQRS